jgi:intracellular multiplication protein IcmE
MSDTAPWWKPSLKSGSLLTSAGQAGPRRLLVIGVSGLVLATMAVIVITSGHHAQPFSQDAHMKPIDPLPAGLHTTPEQDQLALQADTAHATAALSKGISYTPPLAPSTPVIAARTIQATPPAAAAPLPAPTFVPPPSPRVTPIETPIFPPQTISAPLTAPEPIQATPVAAVTANPQAVAAYNREITDLFNQWGGHAPETDVVLPPSTVQTASDRAMAAHAGQQADPPASPSSGGNSGTAATGTVLIPAGRGVYAHPILALNSDETSPAVFQADSGPIAGDRMIGSFERQDDRLIIHVSSIVHQGQTIGCDGVIIAPDTMEASVATGVDEHYLSRVILPAAAAFIQGLGQAIATTSNSVSVLSPLGGATTATNLNFRQQLGVGAGVAGAQVGTFLNQAAPKGPTVTLDANVGVGVMFLTDVKTQPIH